MENRFSSQACLYLLGVKEPNQYDLRVLSGFYKKLDSFIEERFDLLATMTSSRDFDALGIEDKKAVLFDSIEAGLIDYHFGYKINSEQGLQNQDNNFKTRVKNLSRPENLVYAKHNYETFMEQDVQTRTSKFLSKIRAENKRRYGRFNDGRYGRFNGRIRD